ncbi:MAG: ribosome silencing factor [Thermodesulfobacteriota bacterium]|nr:MAG: ribosome silencing factor [Thermodesulfobacteriota bacterium]
MEPKKKALEIARLALDKKAEKVVILNIKKLSTVSDYLVICSAESERQVQAIVNAVEEGLRKAGERPLGIEGAAEGKWALMDYNDVVVHVFLEHIRSFYDLEGLWAEAPATEVADKLKLSGAAKPGAKGGKKGPGKKGG